MSRTHPSPGTWRAVVAIAILINLAAVSTGSSMFPGVWAGTRFMIANRHLSYDDKMALKFPDLAPALRFIAAHTRPEASVLIPPSLNQGALTAYLLYPRRVDSHREGFLWGGTPVGTYAYVEGTWPDSVTPATRAAGELVVSQGQRLLIRRVKTTPTEAGTSP